MRRRDALVLNDQSFHIGRYVGRRRGGSRGNREPVGALAIVVDDRGVARVAHARFLLHVWV